MSSSIALSFALEKVDPQKFCWWDSSELSILFCRSICLNLNLLTINIFKNFYSLLDWKNLEQFLNITNHNWENFTIFSNIKHSHIIPIITTGNNNYIKCFNCQTFLLIEICLNIFQMIKIEYFIVSNKKIEVFIEKLL